MGQKDKDILFKELCARMPYGVKVQCDDYIFTFDEMHMGIGMLYTDFNRQKLDSPKIILSGCYYGENVKPYLFPLSSMTDEQTEELRNLIYEHFTLDDEFNEGICFKTYGDILVWLDEKPINKCYFIFDWLNKNHFDYRGLINKSLALNATNLGIYE